MSTIQRRLCNIRNNLWCRASECLLQDTFQHVTNWPTTIVRWARTINFALASAICKTRLSVASVASAFHRLTNWAFTSLACWRRVCEFVFLFLVVCIFRLLTCFACSVSETTPPLSGLLVLFHARQHLVRTNKSAIIGKVALHALPVAMCFGSPRRRGEKKHALQELYAMFKRFLLTPEW